MKKMKIYMALAAVLAINLFSIPLQALNHCNCELNGGLTTVDYYVEGGCCSGLAQGLTGEITNWVPNQNGTYVYSDSYFVSSANAQSKCCEVN